MDTFEIVFKWVASLLLFRDTVLSQRSKAFIKRQKYLIELWDKNMKIFLNSV